MQTQQIPTSTPGDPARRLKIETPWLLSLVWVGIFLPTISVLAQLAGCRDPAATNYNPNAVLNDGSCLYVETAYIPTVKVNPLSGEVNETSGLQMAGGFLWTCNDSGGEAAIYRIDTITNKVLQKVVLGGAVNNDWETMAFDGTHFFIGDVGNNATGERTSFTIYRFAFTAISDHQLHPIDTIPTSAISNITYTYFDQPQTPVPPQANKTKWDCEAMIVDGGSIHLFTKNWIDLTTTHYLINSSLPGNYVASPVETLATNYLVTAADKAPGKNLVVLLGAAPSGFGNHYLHLLSDYSGGKFFNGNKRLINLPNAFAMGQSEAICFRTNSYGYISNERVEPLFINARLFSFDISAFVSEDNTFTFTGDGNWDNAANWSNQRIPPVEPAPGSNIIINPAPGGKCLVNIPVTLSRNINLIVKPGQAFIVAGNLTMQ